MKPWSRERGMTLIVALVMLAVLTMLVASAIRFGNVNLLITGNAQSETEAGAAAQVGLETTVKAIADAPNINALTAQTMTVSTGGMNYSVAITQPACLFNKPVDLRTLNQNNPNDRPCYESGGGDPVRGPNGELIFPAGGCKDQQWDVQAAVDEARTGTKTSLLQGVSVRVGAEVACP